MAEWLGKIKTEEGESYTLSEEGKWSGDDEEIAEELNLFCDPDTVTGAFALLPYGYGAVSKAASLFKAKAEYPKTLPPLPEGAIS